MRQLLRAAAAGRLAVEGIVVVDRDRACPAARAFADPRVTFHAGEWGAFLDDALDALPADAQLVPYHWAPHLLVEWLRRQAEKRGAVVGGGPPLAPRGLPYEGATSTGDRALSYAAWLCPAMCIEPELCPHTRGPRSWSLASDLAAECAADAVDERIVFRSLHLAYGVATIPVGEILAARARVVAGLARGPRTYLVATASHCHALATSLAVAPAGC